MITYSLKQFDQSKLRVAASKMVNASPWKKEKGYTPGKMHIALLGETAYGLHTNQQVNLEVYTGGDGGIDFPDGSNVKTRMVSPGYVPDLMVSMKDMISQKADTYVYAIYNPCKDKVALIGKISSVNFANRAVPYNDKTYMVQMRYSIDNLDEVYDNVTHEEVQEFCN